MHVTLSQQLARWVSRRWRKSLNSGMLITVRNEQREYAEYSKQTASLEAVAEDWSCDHQPAI